MSVSFKIYMNSVTMLQLSFSKMLTLSVEFECLIVLCSIPVAECSEQSCDTTVTHAHRYKA